jgi:hypothetical protein
MFLNVPAANLSQGLSSLALAGQAASAAMQYASDGAKLWWGDADTPTPPAVVPPGKPVPVVVAVSPIRPGYSVAIEHRVNGGPIREAIAAPVCRVDRSGALIFRALLPGQPSGDVEFLPVLRFAGQPISPRLGETAECSRYIVGETPDRAVTSAPSPPQAAVEDPSSLTAQRAGLPLQRRMLSDGTSCTLPIRYFDAVGLEAIFLVDFHRAAEMLKELGLKPFTQEDGKAVASVSYFQYRKTDIGPYDEFSLTLTAAPPADPRPADFVFNLAVTSATANCAGREVWGYNKFVAKIEGTYDRKNFSVTARDSGGAMIGTLEGVRGRSLPRLPHDEFLFSLLDGRMIRALLRVETWVHDCGGDGFTVRIGPSRHPMAENLRKLGLDGARPTQVQYADPYQAMLFPGLPA